MAIHWKIQFMSKNGTACTINIYDDSYSGDPMDVTGAADPFDFEEDDSDDLLNDVVRYRTGYIRVVEQGLYGALSDMYPSAPFDRYVEVLYGQTVVFNGYIQVSNYASEMIPAPRVLELPVISPMGLMKRRTFSNTSYLPPTAKRLGELLDDMLVSYTNYQRVYVPKNMGYPNQVSLGMNISTLVVSPWNDDYHHSMNTDAMLYVMRGKTHEYLIECICKAFGWICHDTPDALVFTCFDHEGDYCYYPVGHVGDNSYMTDAGISASAITLTDYFTSADAEANMVQIRPETGIEISYEGDVETSREFDLKRTYVPSSNGVIIMPSFTPDDYVYPAYAERFSLCNLIPVPTVNETGIVGAFTFDDNDKLSTGTHCVAWYGKEGIMTNNFGSRTSGSQLFWIRFYLRRRTGMKYSLSFDTMYREDGTLSGLADNDTVKNNLEQVWTFTDYYVQIQFNYKWASGSSTMPQLPSTALMFIHNIRLELLEDSLPYAEYRFKPATDSDTIPASGNPAISADITMPISLYRLNDHLIGESVRSTKLTEYPYLFATRYELKGRFRFNSQLTFPHVRLLTYFSRKWRIIAQKFRPWDDEFTLTMQSSDVL